MARDRRPVVIRPSQRRLRSRWQRERARQRSLVIAGAIALFFIVAIPAYGYWTNFIAPPRSVVLQVDDTKYTLGFMHRYLQGVQALSATGEITLSQEPFRILKLLEESEIISKGATSKGIALEPGELDQEIRDRILGSSIDLENTPADQLAREFNEKYRQYLSTLHLSKDEYRSLVEAGLLRDKLVALLAEEIPTVARQARLSWIVISANAEDAEQQIAAISSRVQQGEEFAALAEEYSIDRTSAVKGGDLGWVPEGAYPALDDTIFSLQPNETSKAVAVDENFFFLKVDEVDEARTIEPGMMDQMKEVSLQTWLLQERQNHRVKACFGSGGGSSCSWQYDWLIKRLTNAQ